jgi:hypothetical protein
VDVTYREGQHYAPDELPLQLNGLEQEVLIEN